MAKEFPHAPCWPPDDVFEAESEERMRRFVRKMARLLQMPREELAARVLESWYGWKEWLAVVGGSTSSNGIASCLNGAQALALLDPMQRRQWRRQGPKAQRKRCVRQSK